MNPFKGYNKKVAAIQKAEAEVAARRQDEADQLAVKQLNDIRKTVPVNTDLPPELQAALPPTAAIKKVTSKLPWIFGGLAALGLFAFLRSRR